MDVLFVVREAGVEPARPCEHWHLKPASLPIPPLAQLDGVKDIRCPCGLPFYDIKLNVVRQEESAEKLFCNGRKLGCGRRTAVLYVG